jgi:hypothetical protein
MLELITKTVPVLTGIAAIVLSVYLAWLAHQRSIMPVLVFLYKNGSWVLNNVGSGPALNLRVARNRPADATGAEWVDLLRCYPLAPKETMLLPYPDAMAIAAVYTDVYGKRLYSSYCRDYSTTFARGDKYKWDLRRGQFEADVPELKNGRSREP